MWSVMTSLTGLCCVAICVVCDAGLADLTYEFLSEECPSCAVHKGFFEVYMSVRDEAVRLVRAAQKKYPGKKLVITGHSLGGALINLASVDFQVHEKIVANEVVSFGQPRAGNKQFTEYFTKVFGGDIRWRVTHGLDPVPHVPPQSFGYVHHAYEVVCDDRNTNTEGASRPVKHSRAPFTDVPYSCLSVLCGVCLCLRLCSITTSSTLLGRCVMRVARIHTVQTSGVHWR